MENIITCPHCWGARFGVEYEVRKEFIQPGTLALNSPSPFISLTLHIIYFVSVHMILPSRLLNHTHLSVAVFLHCFIARLLQVVRCLTSNDIWPEKTQWASRDRSAGGKQLNYANLIEMLPNSLLCNIWPHGLRSTTFRCWLYKTESRQNGFGLRFHKLLHLDLTVLHINDLPGFLPNQCLFAVI